jgi:hypothetical protein
MTVKAGDKAIKTAEITCVKCGNTMHAREGQKISKCACGSDTFTQPQTEPSKSGTTRK